MFKYAKYDDYRQYLENEVMSLCRSINRTSGGENRKLFYQFEATVDDLNNFIMDDADSMEVYCDYTRHITNRGNRIANLRFWDGEIE